MESYHLCRSDSVNWLFFSHTLCRHKKRSHTNGFLPVWCGVTMCDILWQKKLFIYYYDDTDTMIILTWTVTLALAFKDQYKNKNVYMRKKRLYGSVNNFFKWNDPHVSDIKKSPTGQVFSSSFNWHYYYAQRKFSLVILHGT